MNKQYWEQYWLNLKHDQLESNEASVFIDDLLERGMEMKCSQFCKWIVENHSYLMDGVSVVDMCCGRGIDSFVIEQLSSNFKAVDIACELNLKIGTFHKQEIKSFCSNNQSPNTLYCRFGFHAIDESDEDVLLDWCSNYLVAEIRSIGGCRPDHTHERRLIDPFMFLEKLCVRGFDIRYFSENYGYAVNRHEDPKIIRLIAQKVIR